jgi:NitT/TauT family transport system ATP-binding protein
VHENAAVVVPAPERAVQIRIDGVGKRFRRGKQETIALDDVNLELYAGEFVAVVGPSGCGKSTLLRLVSGLLPASSGEVLIGGQRVTGPRTDMGIVFQKPILVEWRTVLGNVLLQTDLRSMQRREYEDRARALLESVGLQEFVDVYPHQLSGGMQQRAAIARSLIHRPTTLLMDEPFGALDALTREQIRLDLESLWMKGRVTVFFITHSIDEAVLLADRVAVMGPRPGHIERIVDVDLPRPRGLAARKDPRFAAMVDEITEIFLSRGVLREEDQTGLGG